MTEDRSRSVALVLPPVQSFSMPYSAPAVLAAWLKQRYSARTLVVDAGQSWLTYELAGSDVSEPIERLRRPESYRDMWTVRRTHAAAAATLREICTPWLPERVELSGRYTPPVLPSTWDAVGELLDLTRPSIFDLYY